MVLLEEYLFVWNLGMWYLQSVEGFCLLHCGCGESVEEGYGRLVFGAGALRSFQLGTAGLG